MIFIYFIFYFIFILFIYSLIQTKIIILFFLLRIFDIHLLKKNVLQKVKNIFKPPKIKINKFKINSNAVYLFVPHGATFFPLLYFLMNHNIPKPTIVINKWFQLVPGFVGFAKLFGKIITSNVKNALLSDDSILMYPNGTNELFYNSSKNRPTNILKMSDKLLFYLLKSKKSIHVVTIKNESNCFYFNSLLICIYKQINKSTYLLYL